MGADEASKISCGGRFRAPEALSSKEIGSEARNLQEQEQLRPEAEGLMRKNQELRAAATRGVGGTRRSCFASSTAAPPSSAALGEEDHAKGVEDPDDNAGLGDEAPSSTPSIEADEMKKVLRQLTEEVFVGLSRKIDSRFRELEQQMNNSLRGESTVIGCAEDGTNINGQQYV